MTSPYKAWAPTYLRLGWSPIPMMIRSKDPVPTKYTGASGAYVTAQDVRAWCAPRAMISVGKLSYPPGNVALRLPKDVVGIDVDAHSGKAGAAVLAEAESRWGRLPPTWKATSRLGSPKSGIYLFRVPEGLSWPGGLNKIAAELGFERTGGIELIRWDHRYVMVAPSTNPDANGASYVWVSPEGQVTQLPWGEHMESLKARVLAANQILAESEDGNVPPSAVADARLLDFDLPGIDDIPDMPETWITGLTDGKTWDGQAVDEEINLDELRAWVADRDSRPVGGSWVGGVCPAMDRTISKHLVAIRRAGDEGGAHDAALEGAWAVLGDAAEGHYGLERALVRLKEAFLAAVKGRRGSVRQAKGEWTRMVQRGATKVINEYTNPDGSTEFADEDLCATVATPTRSGNAGATSIDGSTAADGGASAGDPHGSGLDEGVGKRGKGSSAYDYVRDDIGNAQRLKRHMGDNAVWCGSLLGWYVWDDSAGLWRPDVESLRMTREMMNVVRSMQDEAAYIEDIKQRAEFMKFVRSSGTMGKMKAALEGLRSLNGIEVASDKFNHNRRLLHCNNGVVVLGSEDISVRPARRDDYCTQTTGTAYLPEAHDEYWYKFLDKFLPDEEDRRWAQKLLGYSIVGGNPQRILVLCKGKTSTGKTTFSEAVRGALGMYGGPLPLSAMRDHQDERPRPDLLAVFPRRLAAADEVSEAWELHADQVKRITGGGVATARGMFGKAYTDVIPLFTPWIATNNTPRIKGNDAATRARLRVIPWLVQMPAGQQMGRFKEHLDTREAREAILAWAVAGWKLYLEDPTLTDIPPHAAAMQVEVSDELDELDEFIKDICERGPEHEYWVPAGVLYQEYRTWCDDSGITGRDVMSSQKFGRLLTNMGYERGQLRNPADGKTIKVRKGLRIRADVETPVLR